LPLSADAEDEGDDVWRRGEARLSRSRLEVLQALAACLAIPAQPHIELSSSRHPKQAARLTDVVGDLLIVLDPRPPRLRLPRSFSCSVAAFPMTALLG